MVLRSAKASRPSLAKPDAAVPGGRLWETVDFPEEDFARSLRDHSGLLALHAGALYAGLRRSYAEVSEDEPLELRRESFSQEARLFLGHAAQQLGVITSLEGEEDTVEVLDTLEALERLPPAARSVRRALVQRISTEGGAFVIMGRSDGGAVSRSATFGRGRFSEMAHCTSAVRRRLDAT